MSSDDSDEDVFSYASTLFIPSIKDAHYSRISELSLDPRTSDGIRELLDRVGAARLPYINIHVFCAAYLSLMKNNKLVDASLMHHIDGSYHIVHPWCKGENPERVKRSILRYCLYILSIDG
jgi:hypothetical protein